MYAQHTCGGHGLTFGNWFSLCTIGYNSGLGRKHFYSLSHLVGSGRTFFSTIGSLSSAACEETQPDDRALRDGISRIKPLLISIYVILDYFLAGKTGISSLFTSPAYTEDQRVMHGESPYGWSTTTQAHPWLHPVSRETMCS